jgi:hypothetical protein
MSAKMEGNGFLRAALRDLRRGWAQFLLTDLLYKAAAFVLLTPAAGFLLAALVSLSGRDLVADQDILRFLLGPIGWLALLGAGAVSLAILALGQAALMLVAFGRTEDRVVHPLEALLATLRFAPAVLGVTARMVARALLLTTPFVAARSPASAAVIQKAGGLVAR